jgi:hypothetical protein
MSLNVVTQHRELAVLKLAGWAWGKPRIAALLCAFIDRIQEIEDDLHAVMLERTLAEGDLVRLKVLGKLIGQPRLGFALEDYRILLQARGLANVSRGRARDIIAVLELIIGPGLYTLTEVGDATLHLTTDIELDANDVAMLRQVVPDVRAAGVGLQLLFPTDADAGIWGVSTWGSPTEWGSVVTL